MNDPHDNEQTDREALKFALGRCPAILTDGSRCDLIAHGPETDHENADSVSLEAAEPEEVWERRPVCVSVTEIRGKVQELLALASREGSGYESATSQAYRRVLRIIDGTE